MNIEELYSIYLNYPVVCTDTRNVTKGCIFFALKGDTFNGNQFAAKALENGAAYAVVDEPAYGTDTLYILVADVLLTLQQLATYHRSKLKIPFIGITGSNGKTTTKELLNSVLSQHYKTYATIGNLNNHIGVPLTILSVTSEIEVAIIEMGANHPGEIGFLCQIAQPSHGLITNVGKAHLEGFGGFEGVKKTKGELYNYLATHQGIVFINQDNHLLIEMAEKHQVNNAIEYGTSLASYVSGSVTTTTPFLSVNWKPRNDEFDNHGHKASTNLTGIYNLENVLAAIVVGYFLQLSPDEINRGIENYIPANNRSQLITTDKNTLICDYYNANPSSVIVALENLESMPTSNRVLILGDMFELGQEAEAEHSAIVTKAESIPLTKRIFIGSEFYKLRNTTDFFYETTSEAYKALKNDPIANATVLIKGSRGMKLEMLVELL
jgi:UDP-N-acetylmuramoyl-tripeptide--D-alanyl-D-alanine ligase